MNRTSIASERTFGTTSASPVALNAAPLKIGLRTSANGPLVTSGVRTSGSTSPRHEFAHRQLRADRHDDPEHDQHDAAEAHDRMVEDGERRQAGELGEGCRDREEHADRRQQSGPPLRGPGPVPEAERARAGPSVVDGAAHDRNEPNPDKDQDQVEDGHRDYRTLRCRRLSNRRSHVRLVRPTDTTAREGGPHFTGPAWLREPTPPWTGYRATVVDFAPGTRNDWHHHPGGQVLFVLTGHGRVVARRDDGLHEETFGPGRHRHRGTRRVPLARGDRRQLHEPPVGDGRGHGVGQRPGRRAAGLRELIPICNACGVSPSVIIRR